MISTSKIMAVVPFWKRPHISEMFWLGIEELQNRGVDIDVVAAVSDNQNKALAEKYTDKVMTCSNEDLMKKVNDAQKYAGQFDWDYMMTLGSDDIFSKELLEAYNGVDPHYVGILDAVAINLYNGKMRYWAGYQEKDAKGRYGFTAGSGRINSRKSVEDCNYIFYKGRGMISDFQMDRELKNKGYVSKGIYLHNSPFRIGLKTGECLGGLWGNWSIEPDWDYIRDLYGDKLTDKILDYIASLK